MLDKKDFIFTTETTPNVSTNLIESSRKIEDLIGLADAVNVTDSPNCKTKLNSLLVAYEIRKSGLDVILQLTGRDRNQVALESELLGALSVGINKVLCLSGDQPDEDGPMAVNELNSNGLIELCRTMSEGFLTDGTEIKNPLTINSGAADDLYGQLSNPGAMSSLTSKIEQGANFVQTQYCFDFDVIKQYSDKLNEHDIFKNCKILIGMGPLKSAKQADWMRKNLWGINISDEIINRLDAAEDSVREGEKICIELIDQLKDLSGIDGVHLMGPNCESQSANIIKSFI